MCLLRRPALVVDNTLQLQHVCPDTYEDGADPPGAELCIFFCNRKVLNPDTFLLESVVLAAVFRRLNLAPGSAADDAAVARGATRRLSVASGMLSGLLIWESMVRDGVPAIGRCISPICGLSRL